MKNYAVLLSLFALLTLAGCGDNSPFESDKSDNQNVFDFSMIPTPSGKPATEMELNDVGSMVNLMNSLSFVSVPSELNPLAAYKTGYSPIEDLANQVFAVFANCVVETISSESGSTSLVKYQFQPATQCNATLSGSQTQKSYVIGTQNSNRLPTYSETTGQWIVTPAQGEIVSIKMSFQQTSRKLNLNGPGETSTQNSTTGYSFDVTKKNGEVYSVRFKIGNSAEAKRVTDQRNERKSYSDMRASFNLNGQLTVYQSVNEFNSAQNKSQKFVKINGFLQ